MVILNADTLKDVVVQIDVLDLKVPISPTQLVGLTGHQKVKILIFLVSPEIS